MSLRVCKDLQERFDSEREAGGEGESDHLLSSTLKRESFATEPLEVVNMGLHQLRAARGTATRKMKTVKKAWGTFKAVSMTEYSSQYGKSAHEGDSPSRGGGGGFPPQKGDRPPLKRGTVPVMRGARAGGPSRGFFFTLHHDTARAPLLGMGRFCRFFLVG